MNIKANWLEYLIIVLGAMLITPLQQSVFIPMIESGLLAGLLILWLAIYGFTASRKTERSLREGK
jgi:hypothetical protein